MAEVASAFVSLMPSAKGFGSKLDSEIGGDIKSSGKKHGKLFGGVMVGAAGAAIGGAVALGGFLKGAIGEARDAQKVGALTNAVIKSTGGVANVTAKDVDRLATSISLKTGVDDEAIAAGQNMLLTFGNVRNEVGKGNDIFNQATVAATDMAAAFGGDAVSNSKMLGKALNDPTKGVSALTRVGVSFTEQQKKQIKTLQASGDVLGAQKVILGELSKQTDGAAESQATAGQKFKTAFGNLQETVGTALLPMLDGLQNAGTKVIGFISDRLVPAFSNLGDRARAAKDKIATAFQSLNLGPVARKVVDAFKGINPAGLAAQAKGWAKPIIDGFKTGLDSGDWAGLGLAIGKGLVSAIKGLGALAGTIGDTLGGLFAKVDWVGIGIAMGKQVPSLLIGLAAGILNFDLMGLLSGLAKHWQDILLAIIAVAFTPAKVIGKVGQVLARIPFVGKLLEWALLHFKRFSDGLVRMAGKALGFLGKAFLDGFRRVFPKVGASFADALKILPTRIGLLAIELQAKALGMVRRIGVGIAKGIGSVVAKIGELIARMIRPFAGAASWLISKGAALVAGLGRGIASRVGQVAHLVASIPGKIKGFFSGAGKLLLSIGGDIVQGLVNGIRGAAGRVLDAAKALVAMIPGPIRKLMGIASPSKVMHEIGGHITQGLINGLKAKQSKLKDQMQSMRDQLSALKQESKDFAATVAGAFKGQLFNTETGGLAGLTAQIGTDTNNVLSFMAAFNTAQRKGLSGGLAKELAASGDTKTAQDIAALSTKQIAVLEDQYNQLNKLTAGIGADAANQQFGKQIQNQNAQILKQNALISRVEHKLDALPDKVRQGTREGIGDKSRETTQRRKVKR